MFIEYTVKARVDIHLLFVTNIVISITSTKHDCAFTHLALEKQKPEAIQWSIFAKIPDEEKFTAERGREELR